jgi:hypothetical protein
VDRGTGAWWVLDDASDKNVSSQYAHSLRPGLGPTDTDGMASEASAADVFSTLPSVRGYLTDSPYFEASTSRSLEVSANIDLA